MEEEKLLLTITHARPEAYHPECLLQEPGNSESHKTFKKGTGLTGRLIEHGWVLGSEGSHLESNSVWAGNSHTATLWK